jgi:adenylate cyclase
MTGAPQEQQSILDELAYYKRQLDELAGENLKLDYTISGLRHEIQQKRQSFALLSALQQSIGTHKQISSIFDVTIRAINATLGMDKTVVLSPTEKPNLYRASQWLGLPEEAASRLVSINLEFPPEFAAQSKPLLVNRASESTPLVRRLREAFDLPFFICVPVIVEERPVGLLLSGRMKEARPLYPALDRGDVDTFQAIAGLISASVQNMRIAVLTEMDRLKTEFFANISHEFRTPITLTLGPLQQLIAERHGPMSSTARGELQMMLRNQQRLLGLINQIMDLAKFEAGRMQLRAAKVVDVNQFIAERANEFRAIAEKQGLELSVRLDPQLRDANLYVDLEKLDRLVSNLLSNAVKFTKAGSITVATALRDEAMHLTISDTGIGIKGDELPHIFDRFRQADGSISREYSGTGIGLALVREIAALHGGSVSVRSQYGEGSTFEVEIPTGKAHLSPSSIVEADLANGELSERGRTLIIAEDLADQADVEATNREAEAQLDTTRPTVLYVDDNSDLRAHVRQLLTRHYNVFLAADGLDGLEKARRYLPDLVLSDQMMPRLSGREFLAAVRQDDRLQSTPLIFLTARAGTEARIESLEAGADDYLAKPFDEQELLVRIGNLLRARAQERQLAVLNKQLGEWNAKLEDRVREQVGQLEKLGRLKRFFSPQLADLIIAGGADDPLKSHRRELAVAFLDLRGFTAFSEISEPEEIMAVLHQYHAAIGELILAHEGTLERFTGDGMVVFFNDPLPVPNPAERAVRMAIAMRECVGRLSLEWRKRDYRLDFGIGLTQGFATIGAIGFEARWDYSAIGSVINLAARLCEEAKPGQILMSRRLLSTVEHLVEVEPVGDLALKGFHNPVPVYNLMKFKEE